MEPAKAKLTEAAKHFVAFVNNTGSPYHSVLACIQHEGMLKASGFVELQDGTPWKLERGGKYFVTKGGSELMAFTIGGRFKTGGTSRSGMSLIGAHTDSPCLRLRPNSKTSSGEMMQVGVQTYGGGLWHTWFDRPLGFAGKVVVREAGAEGAADRLVEKLVDVRDPLLVLPNLAIHLQTAEERKAFAVNPETHLQPVMCTKAFDQAARSKCGGGCGGDDAENKAIEKQLNEGVFARHHTALLERVAKELGCQPADIVDADLCLQDSQPACLAGLYSEFINAPRIDNQLSTWACIKGICDFSSAADAVAECEDICVAVSFDHEECGSQSATGADGATLPEWLETVLCTLEVPLLEQKEVLARSFMISADGAHGLHPNYTEKHQKEHRPDFHKGVVIKVNSNQRYATTALTSAVFRELCKQGDVPVQDFVVRNDSPCGTTIGPICSAKLGIRTIDVGAPQWAMHSIRETCSANDAAHLTDMCRIFYEKFRKIDGSISAL